jgi:CelD/BcsL family acetyltransferase involved in cellulose biosynthesis
MVQVLEINEIEELAAIRQEWGVLLGLTAGASFFQSLEWLEIYWRHFGQGQRLRVLVIRNDNRTVGILPLVVRSEDTRVGQLRVLNYPLHDWGSFYGPIGPKPEQTLAAGLEHIRHTVRDWDFLELRWQGSPDNDAMHVQRVMREVGFQGYATRWAMTSVVDLSGTWESYWAGRKGSWLRRFRHAEKILGERGEISYVRYRPKPKGDSPIFADTKIGTVPDGLPRWDLYDTCEELARQSWQGAATDGTTLSHEAVRGFLRETHEAAAAAGAVDMNILSIDGVPVGFIYGYHANGYVYGLRRGYDANRAKEGVGNVLLAYTLRDSFARGDRIYDMGVGSLESKRHFQTRLQPILRFSHYPLTPLPTQLLRVKRWWQSRHWPTSIAVDRAQDDTADSR